MSPLRERPIAILPGQYFDAETGLHQNWHRDYDPSIGRYLQSDPIGLDGGLSTYGYGLQNPLTFTDPTGEAAAALAPTAAELCLSNPHCVGSIGAGLGVSLACVLNPDLCSQVAALACEDLKSLFGPMMNAQDKKLSPGEIKKLKDRGIDPEELKGGKSTGGKDLFKDKDGNIIVKPKDGSGPGDPTGININNL